MTNFTKTRLTDKGLALLAKEGVSVTITKVKTGNGEYQADENTGEMTQLKSEKQQFEVLSATKKSDTVYSIKFAMSNKELSEDYLFTEVGVYATDPDEGEILYAVCYATNENADIIRKFNGLFDFKAIIVLNISVNAGGTVKFISEGMYAFAEDVQELSQKFGEHIEDKNVHVTEEKQKKWDAVEDKVDKLEAAEIKMLGWSVPRVCPIQNEVNDNQFIQKVGRVDLGRLPWEYVQQFTAFRFASNNKEYTKYGIKQNTKLYLYGFNYIGVLIRWSDITNTDEKSIAGVWVGGLNDGFIIKSTTYTDTASFKAAMQGRYLYYELATPIIKTIDGNEIDQRHSMNLTNQQNNGYLQKNLVDYKSLFNESSNNVTGTTHTYSDGVLKISRVKDKDSGVYAYSKQITPLQSKELVVSFDAKSSVSTMNLRVYICSEGVKPGTTENLTTDYKRYRLDIKAGNAGNVFIIYGNDVAGDVWIKNLMITEKYVEDTTYVDRIKSNMELDTYKADKSETTVNLLNPSLHVETKNEVTCTNNGDGTYTLKGTATNVTYFVLERMELKKGKIYKIIGNPNSDKNLYSAFVQSTDLTDVSWETDYNGIFTPKYNSDYNFCIRVAKGTSCNNLLYKPMLTTNLNATLDDFVAYTGNTGSLNGDMADVRKDVDSKLSKANVVNNLITTESGFALDAMQGYTLDKKITDLKKSVSDGKSAVASAITANGVSTASDASFATMAENIGNIFYKRLGKQLPKYFYSRVSATNGSNGAQNVYRNTNTTTDRNWLGHETFFGGSLTDMNGCIIITWLKGTSECAFTIMRLKSEYLGVNNFENLFENNLKYQQMDDGTITLVSKFITPGIEINTLCLACHN